MPQPLGPKSLEKSLAQSSWPLFTPTTSGEADEISKQIEEKLIKQLTKQQNESKFFDLSDIAPFLTEGIEVLVEDEFTKCFTSRDPDPWNWNVYLYPAWLLGSFVRYCFLFPLRLMALLTGTFIFAVLFTIATTCIKAEDKKFLYQRKLLILYAKIFVVSWSGVIKYHGVRPMRGKNQIFVANHTTVLDIVILQQHFNYAIVGQKHKGAMGFVQKNLLKCMGCLWFNRAEVKDRLAVAQKIKAHIENEKNNPLLIFPEGVCVNNKYCVMFKKGAFELGAVVHPIAIKYNTLFVDAFWNSRKESVFRHIFRLMTSWAVVCDVWYLEPQTIRPDETSTQFANRVKAMIAKKAGLINVHWDGYLKYFRPSSRFMETKQRIFAQSLMRRYSTHNPSALGVDVEVAGEQPAQSQEPGQSNTQDGAQQHERATENGEVDHDKENASNNVHSVDENNKPKLNGHAVLRKPIRFDAAGVDR